MRLFIPRKQNITGAIASSASTDGPTVDKAHLERTLHENFLAIERWGNQQGVGAALGSTGFFDIPGTSVVVGRATFAGYDYFNLNRLPTNEINLPEAGLWFCQCAFSVTNAGSGAIIGAAFGDTNSGASTPRHEHTYPQGPWQNQITLSEVIEWIPTTYLVGLIQVSALSTTTSPTQYRMTALTALKLMDIPSRVQ